MNVIKYGLINYIRKRRSSVSFTAVTFVVALAVMFCTVTLGVCDIYKSRNENPYSDYYRLLIDRNAVYTDSDAGNSIMMPDLGYETEDMMFCGYWFNIKQIGEYFRNITDYTVEITGHTTTSMNPIIPPGIGDTGFFLLYGITDCKELAAFSRGELTLTDGRYINSSDRTEKNTVCMISEEIALLNSVGIGDRITIKMADGSDVPYTVVGIYNDNVVRDELAVSISYNLSANRIYVPLPTFDAAYATACYNYQIKLDDDSHISEIERLVNEYSMCEGYPAYFIRVSDIFEANNRGIHSLMRILEIVEAAFIATALFLMMLFVNSLVKSRKHEIGVLLSLGCRKRDAAGMLLTELSACFVTATAFATAVTALFGASFAKTVLSGAMNNTAAETITNTSSDILMLASHEAAAFDALIAQSFIPECIKAALIPIVIIALAGFASAVFAVLRLKVIGLLTDNGGE